MPTKIHQNLKQAFKEVHFNFLVLQKAVLKKLLHLNNKKFSVTYSLKSDSVVFALGCNNWKIHFQYEFHTCTNRFADPRSFREFWETGPSAHVNQERKTINNNLILDYYVGSTFYTDSHKKDPVKLRKLSANSKRRAVGGINSTLRKGFIYHLDPQQLG